MKQLLPVLLISIFLFSCQNTSERKQTEQQNSYRSVCENDSYDFCVKVVSISDGDTFRGLTEDKENIKFRIYGIDAPEKYQAFGNRSTQYLADLIFGEMVGIKVKEEDYFGRLVVWVHTPDGKDVSAEMLRAGMAWHFKKYDDSKAYASLENKAKLKKIGLWVDMDPTPPWQFRRDKKNKRKK